MHMKSIRRSLATAASSSSSSSGIAPMSPTSSASSWRPLKALHISVPSATGGTSDGTGLKSPWSRRKRKHSLSRQQWIRLFTKDGMLRDGGVKFLKIVRSGGVAPDIRAAIWPFLLGVFKLDSSEAERKRIRKRNREEYKRLRKQCYEFFKPHSGSYGDIYVVNESSSGSSPEEFEEYHEASHIIFEGEAECNSGSSHSGASFRDEEYFYSECSADECESSSLLSGKDESEDNEKNTAMAFLERNHSWKPHWTAADFASWHRIIRLDAVRADTGCDYFSMHENVSMEDALHRAQAVGLKDYEELKPSRIYHAARLVEVLESYAIYDQEIGYCQGMSDLLSPILSVMKEDHEAFWCFVFFMKKARENFRLDEAGIKKQLMIVSNIIKLKDAHLYRHLERLEAGDCSFVYRMVVVLFRRELTFEQTLCLWEVLWADQVAIHAKIRKSRWGRIRPRAPPTEDLLLYAIAASVLQKRKLIIEKYSSMDEIVRECNNMTGHLDVWKLLDDAHDLVVALHDKV